MAVVGLTVVIVEMNVVLLPLLLPSVQVLVTVVVVIVVTLVTEEDTITSWS